MLCTVQCCKMNHYCRYCIVLPTIAQSHTTRALQYSNCLYSTMRFLIDDGTYNWYIPYRTELLSTVQYRYFLLASVFVMLRPAPSVRPPSHTQHSEYINIHQLLPLHSFLRYSNRKQSHLHAFPFPLSFNLVT